MFKFYYFQAIRTLNLVHEVLSGNSKRISYVLGGTPYPTLSAQELLHFLQAGNRMKRPENCSEEL